MVIDVSVRALRRRRRRYALSARGRRVLLRSPFPPAIGLPGGRLLERWAFLSWRVRLPLWMVLMAAGWLALGWAGIVPGMAAAFLAEMIFSYRRPGRGRPALSGSGPDGPGGSAGVREPRRPAPVDDAGAVRLPADPPAPGTG